MTLGGTSSILERRADDPELPQYCISAIVHADEKTVGFALLGCALDFDRRTCCCEFRSSERKSSVFSSQHLADE